MYDTSIFVPNPNYTIAICIDEANKLFIPYDPHKEGYENYNIYIQDKFNNYIKTDYKHKVAPKNSNVVELSSVRLISVENHNISIYKLDNNNNFDDIAFIDPVD